MLIYFNGPNACNLNCNVLTYSVFIKLGIKIVRFNDEVSLHISLSPRTDEHSISNHVSNYCTYDMGAGVQMQFSKINNYGFPSWTPSNISSL